MSDDPDVLIIGGGVIGLTTAYFLAREGERIAVVDKGDFGQEASWAGAGILAPGNPARARTPVDFFRAQSVCMFPALAVELRERTGIDNGYVRCGGLEFAGEDEQTAVNEWRGEGISFEKLDEEALRRLEPAIAPNLGTAYHLPEMAQLRNPRHVKALLAGCQAYGVQFRASSPVRAFELAGTRVLAVRTDRERMPGGRFLLAAGAWSDQLLEQVGWQPGIHPVRGQIALLNTGTPLFRRVLLWGARYLVPRPDGRVLVGSTEEDAGFEKHTTAGAIADLLTLACRLVPGLAQAPLERSWAGLRPGSPDGLPFLGLVPGLENLFIAAGHFRSGIQLSPATAQALKELLLEQPLTLPLEPFRLDRLPASVRQPAFRS
jgi:glycine oxidase